MKSSKARLDPQRLTFQRGFLLRRCHQDALHNSACHNFLCRRRSFKLVNVANRCRRGLHGHNSFLYNEKEGIGMKTKFGQCGGGEIC